MILKYAVNKKIVLVSFILFGNMRQRKDVKIVTVEPT